VLNDNVASALNFSFHPEILYGWFIPWLLDAGVRRNRLSFAAATIACASVKEDACLALFAVSTALALHQTGKMGWKDRLLFLVAPTTVGLLNLVSYYRVVLPLFAGTRQPTYANFWSNYGTTPWLALVSMIKQPFRVLGDALTSGFFRWNLAPHLFLPFIAWRWILGIVPIVLLYGASANEQLRAFGIYYPMIFVPFLVIASSFGGTTLFRAITRDRFKAETLASASVVILALMVGTYSGYVLRPWKPEVASVPEALQRLSLERVVLVQSGLYPHAGYEDRVQLLTPESLHDAGSVGVAVLLAPNVNAYPFQTGDLDALTRQPAIQPMPPGLVAVRLSDSFIR
jgi:uncharacterized membrane protein